MVLTTVNSGGIKDDSIVNVDIKSDAAIEASKLDNPLQFPDGHIVSFGTTGTGDLELYHSGSHGILKNYTGNLYVYAKGTGNETGMVIVPDGEVQLMNDNLKTFETRSDGIKITGQNNSYAVIEFNADNGDDNADKWLQYAGSDGAMYWQNYSSGSWVNKLSITSAGNVGIGTDNPFEPTNYTGLELNGPTGGCITFSDDDVQKWEIYGDASEIGFYDRGNTRYVFKVKNDQDIEISDGNLVVANGHGIDFSNSQTPAGGMTSELLDHYEEGTFTATPADAASGGNTSSTTFTGYYIRIGKQVTIFVRMLNVDSTGLTGANDLYLQGVPFTSGNLTNMEFVGAASVHADTTSDSTAFVSNILNNDNFVRFYEQRENTSRDYLRCQEINDATTDIIFALTYIAAS